MRIAICMVALMLSARMSAACPGEESGNWAGAGFVPPQPSLFVVGDRLPLFERADGSPIRFNVTELDVDNVRTRRVQLDIDAGIIFVHGSGELQLPAVLWVYPGLKPRTRVAQIAHFGWDGSRYDHPWIDVDTDADLLLIDVPGNRSIHLAPRDGARGDFALPHHMMQIRALYADGTEELIFDYDPSVRSTSPWSRWAAVLLLVLAFSGSRIRRAVPV